MHWSEATMQGGGGPAFHTVQGDRAIEDWAGVTYELVQKRKADPQDDLISMWCHKELDGKPLSDEDIMHEVLLMYASANRDPEVFDNPDALDVRRDARHHVSFGFGTHFCLGASLARLQLKVMFEELTRRLPDMRLEPFYAPRFRPGAFTRGLEGLNVEFTQSEPEGDGTLGMFPIAVQ